MRSKSLVILTIISLTALICFCPTSCTSDSTEEQTETETENQSEPTGDSPALNEETYSNEITAIALEIENTVYELDQSLAEPDITNDEWIFTVTLVLTDITSLCDEATQITPPESMADIHISYLEAIDHLDDAVALLTEGLDAADMDTVEQAAAEIWLATEILNEVIIE